MTTKSFHETAAEPVKALVLHPVLAGEARTRDPDASLEEAVGLAAAISLDILEAEVVMLPRLRPATFIGAGKVASIGAQLDGYDVRPDVIIVDTALSPVQHRNLEKEWNAKVLDRTALILEIFGARAQTAEGRLQVDLAHLTYQRSRLVRSWTHLERQRGGAGFLGGPGERQIESDRRALAEKIDRLKQKIEQVRRTRTLQRAKRKRAPHPVVALVGYTNAGKSTLFNRLTSSEVFAKDLLFATLDTTMRAVDLPSGQRVIMSDTVGFISDLPTQLVAAFRATLEEVLEADIILHVRDAAHEDTEAQRDDVIDVLSALGVDAESDRPVVEVLNKIDLLDTDDCAALVAGAKLSTERLETGAAVTISIDYPLKAPISAVTGAGVAALCDIIDHLITLDRNRLEIRLPIAMSGGVGAARAWLHQRGDIEEEFGDSDITLIARLSPQIRGQFEKLYPDALVQELSHFNDAGVAIEGRLA